MTISVQSADHYFNTEVFLNDAWVSADENQKARALKNAENQLYRYYSSFDPETNPLPEKAVYEQAYFIMLVDETIQKAQLGVKQVSVSGLSISVNPTRYPVSPEAELILQNAGGIKRVRVGRTLL